GGKAKLPRATLELVSLVISQSYTVHEEQHTKSYELWPSIYLATLKAGCNDPRPAAGSIKPRITSAASPPTISGTNQRRDRPRRWSRETLPSAWFVLMIVELGVS
ncbi:MAG: hypothetical protein M3R24_26475, partial [Chloroflexota bacterium]|nr:hypothetical protein [Chloroflexota bacterium]